MSIEIIHPGESSIETVVMAAREEIPIRRSPHVGNVNSNELQLMFGVAALGGTLQLEMVDSIQGDDNYSSPRHVIVNGMSVPIISKKQAKGKIVGACHVGPDGAQNCQKAGVPGINEGANVLSVHQDALEAVLPSQVEVATSTEYFASLGEQMLTMIIGAAQQHVERPVRQVMEDGSIKQLSEPHDRQDIFGIGENPQTGILLPLEAMMATELIEIAMDDDRDSTVIHIAGPDMIRYTKCSEVMGTVKTITQAVLAECGISSSTQDITYIVPCMRATLDATAFPKVISSDQVASQHDIVAKQIDGLKV